MTYISARNICLQYPLFGAGHGRLSGATSPETRTGARSGKYIQAIDDLSFNISSGERVGIVGRNGSGKSTLLRILGGIYQPSSGALEIDGDVSALFNINLGTQPDATGRQNIRLRGLIRGMKRKEIAEKMEDIIAFSELGDFIDMPLRTYSTGMAMRLSFAIATSFTPQILLLDEWIGAGDKAFQVKAAERMNALVDAAGITVIASHNRSLLKRVCDKAIWLDRGHMRGFGPIDEIYAQMDTGH